MKFKTILERTVAAWIGMCTLLLLIRPDGFARYQRQFLQHPNMGLFPVYHCGIHYNDALSSFYKIQARRHLAFCCFNFTVFAACCRSCGRYCYIFCLCCSSRYCFVILTAPNTKRSHSNTWQKGNHNIGHHHSCRHWMLCCMDRIHEISNLCFPYL